MMQPAQRHLVIRPQGRQRLQTPQPRQTIIPDPQFRTGNRSLSRNRSAAGCAPLFGGAGALVGWCHASLRARCATIPPRQTREMVRMILCLSAACVNP